MVTKTFENSCGDSGLDVRGNNFVKSLWFSGTQSIRQLSLGNAEQKGYYRFLENESTKQEAIISSMGKLCAAAVKDRTVLFFRILRRLICTIIKTASDMMIQ